MPSTPPVPWIKPRALQPGDTIGIIAPGSNLNRDLLEAGCRTLERLGYKPFYFDSIFEQDLYFAGTVERRARELQEMFAHDDVRAIICARGGYGTNYLLSVLNLDEIISQPKIFVGYSDVTTLLTRFASSGLITFHGPMVTKDFASADGVDLQSWNAAVSGLPEWEMNFVTASGVKPLVHGSAEGTLYGGCLSMLVASLGTPYEVKTEGTILFIEDVAAKPYQVDRMLMQLKLAGKLADVHGIVFGEMVDCVQQKDQGYSLEEVVLRIVGNLGVPVAYGISSGHVSRQNITLPMGVRTALTVTDSGVKLKILEPATRRLAAVSQLAKS
jgi:muramoyltetrapeptide carboxypeptidase